VVGSSADKPSHQRQKPTSQPRGQSAPANLQSTNDKSIDAKFSAERIGYFHSGFLRFFASQTARRPPMINRAYHVRREVVDRTVNTFVSAHNGACQLVSLGGGFDPRFFELQQRGAEFLPAVYFEVDFPGVVRRKRDVIRAHIELLEAVGDCADQDGGGGGGGGGASASASASASDNSSSPSSAAAPAASSSPSSGDQPAFISARLRILAADLQRLPDVDAALARAGFNANLPTLFVSECVLTYLPPPHADAVIAWAAAAARRCPRGGAFCLYEQLRPNDAFGRQMMRALDTLQVGIGR
jgi:O-methyltransferase involved in polyketide biosynthesis